jgi:hypothetical protein
MNKLIVIALTAFALGFAGFSHAADKMKGSEMMESGKMEQTMQQMNERLNQLDDKVTKILTLMQEKGMTGEKGQMKEEKGGMMEEHK